MPSPWVLGTDAPAPSGFGPFFSGLVAQFGHVTSHVANHLAPVFADTFGLPFGSVAALVELMMHAHGGNPVARQGVEELAATTPGMKQALIQTSLALKQHPHFAHYQAHAVKEGQRVALHGLAGAAHRKRVGRGRVWGTV